VATHPSREPPIDPWQSRIERARGNV